VHHLDSWIKRDQLDVTCFIISLFNVQHVSDVNTSILRSLRLVCWVISWVVLLWFDVCWCYFVVWLWWCGICMQAEACIQIPHHPSQTISNQSNTTHEITQQISRKLLRVDVLTSETCWALNNEILKQVTWSWSLFLQIPKKLHAFCENPVFSTVFNRPCRWPRSWVSSIQSTLSSYFLKIQFNNVLPSMSRS